jgi:hypothetical protein
MQAYANRESGKVWPWWDPRGGAALLPLSPNHNGQHFDLTHPVTDAAVTAMTSDAFLLPPDLASQTTTA